MALRATRSIAMRCSVLERGLSGTSDVGCGAVDPNPAGQVNGAGQVVDRVDGARGLAGSRIVRSVPHADLVHLGGVEPVAVNH